MKKQLWICLLLLALLFSACETKTEQNIVTEAEEAEKTEETKESEKTLSLENATETMMLKWKEELPNGTTCYHCDFIITNNGKNTLSYTIEGTLYNDTGNILNENYHYTSSVQSGQSYYAAFYSGEAEYSNVTYNITSTETSLRAIDTTKMEYRFKSAGNDLEYIVSLTNHDDIDYTNCGLHIFFYNKTEIVHIETVHLQNADYRLNIGETESESFCYTGSYTDYEIYPFGEVILNIQ